MQSVSDTNKHSQNHNHDIPSLFFGGSYLQSHLAHPCKESQLKSGSVKTYPTGHNLLSFQGLSQNGRERSRAGRAEILEGKTTDQFLTACQTRVSHTYDIPSLFFGGSYLQSHLAHPCKESQLKSGSVKTYPTGHNLLSFSRTFPNQCR